MRLPMAAVLPATTVFCISGTAMASPALSCPRETSVHYGTLFVSEKPVIPIDYGSLRKK
jgi:hypothetical protein